MSQAAAAIRGTSCHKKMSRSSKTIITYLLAMLSLRFGFRAKHQHFIPLLCRGLSNSDALSAGSSQEPQHISYSDTELHHLTQKLKEHQAAVANPSNAEYVRTLITQSHGYGVLSTNSVQQPGFPIGSIVGFSLDEDGKPFSVLSSLSSHTADLLNDGRCSLVVTEKDFGGADQGRVTLVGTINKVNSVERRTKLREIYLKSHPGAYWIDFG